MRVLHLHTGNLYGGVETMLTCLQRHVSAMPECTMTYALTAEGKLAGDLREAGGDVIILPPVRLRSLRGIMTARRAVRALIDSGRFDLVVSHSTWTQAVFGPAVRRTSVPLLFWQHNAFEERHWIERLASFCPPDFAISNSHYSEGTLSRVFPRVDSEVVYYPVERPPEAGESRSAVRSELQTDDGDTVIIQVSRMERWKGQTLLIDALGHLSGLGGWTCWQVGGAQRDSERQYEREVHELATQKGLADRIRFTGHRHDVSRLLAAADIHCQPNLMPESFGITFIEALYRGLPVVTTRMGGAMEIVEAGSGILVPTADPVQLAAALERLIVSARERAALSKKAPARAAELCHPDAQAARIHAVFSRLT